MTCLSMPCASMPCVSHRSFWDCGSGALLQMSLSGRGGGPAVANLTDSLAVELSQPDSQQQRVKNCQRYQHRQHRKVRELGHERSTQALAGVNQGIHQYDFLEDGEMSQRAPGIVGTAKKDHWSQNHAEHEADMSLIDAATKRQT